MPPTKKYENPWVGFELTPSGDMLDLNAMTTTQRGPVIKQCFTNKAHSNSARFSDRKKIRGYPSEPSLIIVSRKNICNRSAFKRTSCRQQPILSRSQLHLVLFVRNAVLDPTLHSPNFLYPVD